MKTIATTSTITTMAPTTAPAIIGTLDGVPPPKQKKQYSLLHDSSVSNIRTSQADGVIARGVTISLISIQVDKALSNWPYSFACYAPKIWNYLHDRPGVKYMEPSTSTLPSCKNKYWSQDSRTLKNCNYKYFYMAQKLQ